MAKQDKKAEETAQEQKTVLVSATVKKSFRDKDSFDTIYSVGQTVEFEQERIDDLVQKELVEVEKPADAGTKTDDSDPK